VLEFYQYIPRRSYNVRDKVNSSLDISPNWLIDMFYFEQKIVVIYTNKRNSMFWKRKQQDRQYTRISSRRSNQPFVFYVLLTKDKTTGITGICWLYSVIQIGHLPNYDVSWINPLDVTVRISSSSYGNQSRHTVDGSNMNHHFSLRTIHCSLHSYRGSAIRRSLSFKDDLADRIKLAAKI